MKNAPLLARLLGAAVLCSLLGCRTPPFGPPLKARVLEQAGRVLEREAYANRVDFSSWHVNLRKHWPAIDGAATPAGRTIEDVGLVPEALLADEETAQDERILSKAREVLRGDSVSRRG